MQTSYFNTPSAAVAVNFKVGSATLARAIIAAHHPDINSVLTTPSGNGNGTAYPAGQSADTVRTHAFCPKLADPKDRPVTLLVVRDPVDKFCSACVESNVTDIDAKLAELETKRPHRDGHFWPQSRLLKGNLVKLYKFPADLDALAIAAGLALPLPNIDGGNDPDSKPVLSEEQLARVQAIYAADIALFESITEVGQEFSTAKPAPVLVPEEIALWRAKAVLQLSGLLTAVNSLLDAMTGNAGIIARAAWSDGAPLARRGATVVALAAALELTDAQVDAMFIQAASLAV